MPALRLGRLVLVLALPLMTSCATSAPRLQPQINSLVVAERFDQAVSILETQKEGYGKNNQLLYLLDKAFVLHLAGKYEQSIPVFEDAKLKYEQMYTRSVSRIAGSVVWNDYALPYVGEDFERVLINVFQALNYAVLGNFQEALVDARDVDSKLNAINAQYPADKKNVYREDAFARFLMGVLYEATGSRQDYNDAYVSYRKALEIYQSDYKDQFQQEVPLILKENLLAAAQEFDTGKFREYQHQFGNIPFAGYDVKKKKAEIYLVHYNGLAPIKHQEDFFLPLPGGYLGKVAFPQFDRRETFPNPKVLLAQAQNGKKYSSGETELGENIEAISIKNLQDRRLRTMAKAIGRPMAKYALERTIQEAVRERNGSRAARWVALPGSLFNIFSEQADLRSWQTLPAQIRLTHLLLDPGEYQLSFDNRVLGTVTMQAGEKKFFISRTTE